MCHSGLMFANVVATVIAFAPVVNCEEEILRSFGTTLTDDCFADKSLVYLCPYHVFGIVEDQHPRRLA
ncbi:hypothetical protein B0O80DRAFT_440040 [Mortierella sp. GBAus27b]|nr:hypothetical protein B0O80DRAFT_440036 [Mortierella sp. GBAus27b]KAI8359337.1 hypothetical protein B0O80DRAFT_440040 [Mortierella sp. GBAus27b]